MIAPRTTRTDLIRRIRAGLGRAVTPLEAPPPPEIDESLIRLAERDVDRVALFAERGAAAGVNIHRTSLDALASTVERLLATLGARSSAVCVRDPMTAGVVESAVRAAGVTAVDWTSQPGLEALYDVDVGITDVDAAIAETGTLVIESCAERSRGAHLVPPAHIAIVPARSIVADLVDCWATMRRGGAIEPPSATVLVTGPSKTADIEGILVTGVHGPGTVHAVVVEAP